MIGVQHRGLRTEAVRVSHGISIGFRQGRLGRAGGRPCISMHAAIEMGGEVVTGRDGTYVKRRRARPSSS